MKYWDEIKKGSEYEKSSKTFHLQSNSVFRATQVAKGDTNRIVHPHLSL